MKSFYVKFKSGKLFEISSCIFFLFLFLITISPNAKAQDNNVLLNRLCKTWVAYEETNHTPMLNRDETRELVKKEDRDSIIINSDSSVIRFHRDRVCHGNWRLNSDSTMLVIKFSDCEGHYFSEGIEAFIISTLKANTIEMKCDIGPEGEHTERKFKAVE